MGGDMIQKSEEIREKNFREFEKRYGFRPQIDTNEDNYYRMELAKNGDPILFIKGAGLNGADLRMNSEYDPVYESKRWVERFEFINRMTIVLLMGFGVGYSLGALVKKLRPDTKFYVYEPQESVFSYVCGCVDITDFINHPRIFMYVSKEQQGLYVNDVMMNMITYSSETEKIYSPYYAENKEFEECCAALTTIMNAQSNYQQNRGRISLKCRLYAWNHMRNASLLKDLRAVIPEGMPAVIVSAGPSLNKNVDVLKRIKGHALIISSDRAINVLDDHGIEPDMVVTAEPVKDPAFLKYKVAEKIPLLCSMQANSESQKLFKGRCIYFHTFRYEHALFGDRVEADFQGLDLGGNVSGACFVACERLGIKTIILIGQDMAYLDGKHHADKSDSGGDDARNLETIEIPGALGGTVKSCAMWREFRDFFERRIKLNPTLRVIDATEGGALIHGSEVMTLSAVADKLEENTYDITNAVRNLPKAQTDEEYEDTVVKLQKWCDDLDMIARNSEEIATICNQLLNVCKYQDISDKKNNNKINKLDNLRDEIYKTVINSLMEDLWVEDLYSIPGYQFMIRNNEEAIPVFEDAKKYYAHLPEDCKSLKEAILEAIEEGKSNE
ncbi:motility associated factor glycosyltransferase family protein [Butyrivibrio sp. LC3010]|uniref:motility associated factor glycosyltransferase family protein n=1 Tax=Butyrivibrio sp. LC3010 TaxID=1280680 RepID=UPI00041BDB64|nr:6-hydroxymethylpterin diphosphokinase MptE-like protein [Butyrivibrio sp. LC3010]